MRDYNFTPFYIKKPIALVGMMGVGKTTIGKRLAKKLGVAFKDSDQEVEKSAGGYSVADIYEQWGEQSFRNVERNVIQRLLKTEPMHILSTGEGAFLDPQTRAILQDQAIVVWLKSDIKTLVERLQRKARPQLGEMENPEEMQKTIEDLIEKRTPIYSMADISVESNDEFYQDAVDRICLAVKNHLYPIDHQS